MLRAAHQNRIHAFMVRRIERRRIFQSSERVTQNDRQRIVQLLGHIARQLSQGPRISPNR